MISLRAKDGKSNASSLLIWAGFTAVFIALAHYFPISGDDWDWGVSEELPFFNGRYFGNLLVMLLTKALRLRPFVVGLTVSFIAFATASLAGGKRFMLPAVFLTLAIPQPMFTQVYQWTSGFCNFAFPVALIMTNLLIMRNFHKKPRCIKIFLSTALAAISLSTQLFAEHITIFTVLFSLIFIGYRRIGDKKWDAAAIVCSVAYIAGAFVMFMNRSYHESFENAHVMPGYSDMLSNAVSNYFHQISPHLVYDGLWINIPVILMNMRLLRASGKKGLNYKLIAAVMTLFAAVSVVRVLHPGFDAMLGESVAAARAAGLLAFLYMLAIAWSMYACIPPGWERDRLLLCILAIAAVNGPLLIVDPIGPRCFFISYVFFILMLGFLYQYVSQAGILAINIKASSAVMAAVLTVLLCTQFYIYSKTAAIYEQRRADQEAAMAAGESAIRVKLVPYWDYVWQANPISDYLEIKYKKYYGIPAEKKIIVE